MTIEKNLQTKISDVELTDLEEICRREQISKREALREAIGDWIKKKKGFDADDPLFRDDPLSIEIEKNAGQVDEVVYKRQEDRCD